MTPSVLTPSILYVIAPWLLAIVLTPFRWPIFLHDTLYSSQEGTPKVSDVSLGREEGLAAFDSMVETNYFKAAWTSVRWVSLAVAYFAFWNLVSEFRPLWTLLTGMTGSVVLVMAIRRSDRGALRIASCYQYIRHSSQGSVSLSDTHGFMVYSFLGLTFLFGVPFLTLYAPSSLTKVLFLVSCPLAFLIMEFGFEVVRKRLVMIAMHPVT